MFISVMFNKEKKKKKTGLKILKPKINLNHYILNLSHICSSDYKQ